MKAFVALLLALPLVAGADDALARNGFKGGAPAGHVGAPSGGGSPAGHMGAPSGGFPAMHFGGFHGHSGFAHSHPFFRSRIIVGGPLFFDAPVWPYYYYPPYYPPAYAEPQYVEPETTYIEQPSNVAPAQQYFYYCPDSR